MKSFTITNKKGETFKVLVDDEDFERVEEHCWHVNIKSRGRVKHVACLENKIKLLIHRFILELLPGDGKLVDHIDMNPLNNQKSNLRVCTNAENTRNRNKQINNTVGFKGVSYWKRYPGKYRAKIKVNRIEYYLGTFSTPEEAALAYNEAARKYHGEFAHLNKIEEKK